MADPVRIRRVAEQIRAELSQILREEVRDPRIRLVTVTRVKLAADLGAATIFYCPLGEEPAGPRGRELEEAMRGVTGFARRLLSQRMKLRHTPDLRFVLDDSIAEGSQTLALIRSLELRSEEAASDSPGEPGPSGGGPAGGDPQRETEDQDGETQFEA
ncbi:MAG TPA: 30S ribosome-binding factor RbfA [Deltaproteobacteria bacterium]|nr:30S ribosome-binding factor RbfA [Deltaproteobacteria bacterium]